VLLANTAVPAWQHGARTLPPLFVASSAASAASALDLFPSLGRPAVRALRVFGTAGKAVELLAGAAYERALSRVGTSVVRHIRSGRAGTLFRLSEVLTAASMVGALSGKRRLSGLLGLGGALALRLAVTAAGRASALDPRASFEPQRAFGQDPRVDP
ncbi:MAG: hypothetical protein JOZ69_13810, partial [Myxococcales bacterium]|nr:hypothetical protein [Myxococcales bacterium]